MTIETANAIHRFYCERLLHAVDEMYCKATITKKRKLLISLWKVNRMENWTRLRGD